MRIALLATCALTAALSTIAAAQASHGKPAQHTSPSDKSLIDNALSAAPPAVAAVATVMGHDGRVLRKGSSDWVCMPDMLDVPNDTPMCLDAPWRAFIDAWMNRRAPSVTQLGFGYMLQEDMPVSNTDPFATAPTATNQWIQRGAPHVMVLLPDARLIEQLPTDPTSGGPFVMWKGTPYAHVMVPAVARAR
jgi:hypothetical protein